MNLKIFKAKYRPSNRLDFLDYLCQPAISGKLLVYQGLSFPSNESLTRNKFRRAHAIYLYLASAKCVKIYIFSPVNPNRPGGGRIPPPPPPSVLF